MKMSLLVLIASVLAAPSFAQGTGAVAPQAAQIIGGAPVCPAGTVLVSQPTTYQYQVPTGLSVLVPVRGPLGFIRGYQYVPQMRTVTQTVAANYCVQTTWVVVPVVPVVVTPPVIVTPPVVVTPVVIW